MDKKLVLYKELKETIKSWITSGKYKEGDRLPTERALVKELDVSRITILGALKELEKEGYISRHQGKGTFVKSVSPFFVPNIKSGEKTTITFGVNGYNEFKFFYHYLITLFEAENPDVNVELMSVPMSARMAECPYMLRLMSGDLPMVGEFFMHADYAAMNGLYPLDEFSDFESVTSDVFSKLSYKTANHEQEERYHAIPLRYTPRLLFVNPDMAEKVGIDIGNGPETLSDLGNWITKLCPNKNSHGRVMMDYQLHHDSVIAFLPYIWNFSDYRNVKSKEDFTALLSQSPKWLAFFAELFKKRQTIELAEHNTVANFLLGKTGLLLSSSLSVLHLKNSLYPDFEVKPFLIPAAESYHIPIQSLGDMSIGIFRSAIRSEAELAAAWRWIKFLLKPDIQTMQSEAFHLMPSVRGLDLNHFSAKNLSILDKAAKYGEHQYDFKDIRKVYAILIKEIHQVFLGKASTNAAIDAAIRKISENVY